MYKTNYLLEMNIKTYMQDFIVASMFQYKAVVIK